MNLKQEEIIVKPLVTERSTKLRAIGKYVFQVHKDANKAQIKKAVESLFKVRVRKVHVLNVPGKRRYFGRAIGRMSDWKKAIVTLPPGEQIVIKGIFEEA